MVGDSETRPPTESQPDEREPTPERRAELRAAYEANLAASKAPYDGVWIRTLGELRWLVGQRDWSDSLDPRGKPRPDLRGADFGGDNLSGADLQGAFLGGAYLRGTNLSGADLRGARMDTATVLSGTTFDTATQLCDVVWNSAPLTQVDWQQSPRLGDEHAIKKSKHRRERRDACRIAARAYRGLAIALRAQGLLIPASNYRLREQRLERRARLLEGNLLAWAGLGLLDLTAGYGERPGRIFAAYLVVVLGFALAYFGIVHQFDPTHAVDALVYSLTSFHGRGFFPGEKVTPHDPPVVLAALEAVVGLFIELMLIATFSRRFLGN